MIISLQSSTWARFCAHKLAVGVVLLATASAPNNAIAQQASPAPRHTFLHVTLDRSFSLPVSGRLLLFIAPASGDDSKVDINMMSPESVYVAAKEVPNLAPGESVDIDADDVVFPRPLSQAAVANYRVQAVLDVDHSYNYRGRTPGDYFSLPVTVDLPFSASPTLTLAKVVPEPSDRMSTPPSRNWTLSARFSQASGGARFTCGAGFCCRQTMKVTRISTTRPYTAWSRL